ncbi:MAG: hypothetical protein E7104_00455 [Prevotella sp.]|nr:hypothetical protein [Prevotella sp.]
MKKIKIIKSVEVAPCRNLNGMLRVGVKSVKIPDGIQWVKLSIKPEASMIISNKEEDKNTIYTAKLQFLTFDDILDGEKKCWRVTLTDDTQYLLGTDERPYATVSVTENMPDSVKDNQLTEVVVSYQSHKNIPYIM